MIIACAFPSTDADRAEETAVRWRDRGFIPMIIMNEQHVRKDIPALVFGVGAYEGYYRAMNYACQALIRYEKADVVVCISDRMLPPEHARAHEIATSFAARFTDGDGVMIPTLTTVPGWDWDIGPCGPWIGRRFIEKFYGGEGPYWPAYFQYYGNRELFRVAKAQGDRLWLRPDIAQPYCAPAAPDFYQKHNKGAYWERDKTLFTEREETAFAGSEPNRIITWPFRTVGKH